jgi:hypothetical protein
VKNIDLKGVDKLVKEAVQLQKRKEKLRCSLEKQAFLLGKKCASSKSSHHMLGILKPFPGTLVVVAIVGRPLFDE